MGECPAGTFHGTFILDDFIFFFTGGVRVKSDLVAIPREHNISRGASPESQVLHSAFRHERTGLLFAPFTHIIQPHVNETAHLDLVLRAAQKVNLRKRVTPRDVREDGPDFDLSFGSPCQVACKPPLRMPGVRRRPLVPELFPMAGLGNCACALDVRDLPVDVGIDTNGPDRAKTVPIPQATLRHSPPTLVLRPPIEAIRSAGVLAYLPVRHL